jgi:uncharacterized protein YerC
MTKRSTEVHEAVVRLIEEDDSLPFHELISEVGLDPTKDLRFCDWSGIDMSNNDLRGFDFTGCVFTEVNLEGAKIERAIFENADTTGTDFSKVVRKSKPTRKREPLRSESVSYKKRLDEFYNAFQSIRTKEELEVFLHELLTERELHNCVNRFWAVKLLDEGFSYRQIRDILGITLQTVQRATEISNPKSRNRGIRLAIGRSRN